MARYQIHNLTTREWANVEAGHRFEALAKLGWQRSPVFIVEVGKGGNVTSPKQLKTKSASTCDWCHKPFNEHDASGRCPDSPEFGT